MRSSPGPTGPAEPTASRARRRRAADRGELGDEAVLGDEGGSDAAAGEGEGDEAGDTPAADRRAFAKQGADVLITTPESLFLLLTSADQRSVFAR